MVQFGRVLMVSGGVIALIGAVVAFGPKLPLNFHYQRGNFNFYFPLGTSILISIVLTIVFGLLNKR